MGKSSKGHSRLILIKLNFEDVWTNKKVLNYSSFIPYIKERVKLLFIQETNTRLNNSTREVFYKHIYTFKYQSYLKNVNIQKYRSAMSRLRMASHRLHIETGRWTSTDLTDRTCSYCNTLENEFHDWIR